MDLGSYDKVTIDKFNGLWITSGHYDDCPIDHSTECFNMVFDRKGGIKTREGVTANLYSVASAPIRVFLSAINTSIVPISLSAAGSLYIGTSGSPIYTDANMVDFVGLNVFNRTYLLPILSSGSSSKLLVYNGTTIRNAAGIAPNTASLVIANGAAGNVTAGSHKFTISYLTDSGFITKPGSPVSFTTAGSQKVDLSGIPTGPAGTIGRYIFATKANLDTMYYVPGGFIADNISTTLTVDFFDTDLVSSADDLFDLLESIPAGTSGLLDKFKGRILVAGGEGNVVRVSKSGDPEAFDNTVGYIQITDENDGNNVSATFTLRNVLYFCKVVGIFIVNDNGGDPSTWEVIQIEGAVGGSRYGLSTISATQGHLNTQDVILIASLSGIYIFDGVCRSPELTFKVSYLWNLYTTLDTIHKITICVDPFKTRIYAFVQGTNAVFMGDYSEGLDPYKIKWAMWNFNHLGLTIKNIFIGTFNNGATFTYALRFQFNSTNFIYTLATAANGDAGAAITAWNTTALVRTSDAGLNTFVHITARLQANSALVTFHALKEDFQTLIALNPAIIISAAPGREYYKKINIVGEKMALRLTCTDPVGMSIDETRIYGTKYSDTRPG